jgi:hypothetical protein
VKWQEKALMPIGGWRRRHKEEDLFVTGTPRAAYIWRANDNIIWLAIGCHNDLWVFENATDKIKITPTDFISGTTAATVIDGYGMMDYGEGVYNEPRGVGPDYALVFPATMWTFSTWGEYLIGHTRDDGRIFEYVPHTPNAVPVTNAPINNQSFVVTNERILMALGADALPRLIRWSDQEDRNTWTPTDLNQAGDFTLQTNGTIITGRTTPDGVLIWTTEDCWMCTYQGFPLVYGFHLLAGKTSLASRQAMAVIDSRVVWMGTNGFYIYDGYVNPLPCDVQDRVFNDLNVPQISKSWALVNHDQFEVVWFYPDEGSNGINNYVTWNYKEQYWTTGKTARTCGVPAGILPTPIMVTAEGFLYDHNVGWDYEGLIPYIESWPIEIADGGQEVMIQQLIPDEVALGDVEVTFKARQYPTSIERTKTYTLKNPTNTRVAGRQIALRFDGVRPTQWRIGRFRMRVKQLGSR